MNDTKGIYDSALSDSTRHQEDIANKDTNMGQGLLATGGDTAFGSYSNNPDPNVTAIRQRAGRDYGDNMQEMKQRNNLEARNTHFAKLQQASGLAAEENKLNFQKYMAAYRQKMAKKAARGAAIGNVLGIAGGVVGGVVTMNPMGAMAGYQGGQAVGNAVGGS